MKRTKLKDRVLPKYTKGEEIFNMVTHIVGGGFAVIALISCIIVSLVHKNYFGLLSRNYLWNKYDYAICNE